MESIDNNSNTNSTHLGSDTESQAKNDVMKQFYFIITVVFIVLIIFLGFFIYNLIKCYLPKWMNKNKNKLPSQEETSSGYNSRKIEFEEIV